MANQPRDAQQAARDALGRLGRALQAYARLGEQVGADAEHLDRTGRLFLDGDLHHRWNDAVVELKSACEAAQVEVAKLEAK